jgi:hypothetical protein
MEEIDVSGATYARGDGGNKVDGWGQYGGTPSLYLADKVDYKSDLVFTRQTKSITNRFTKPLYAS